MLPVSNPGAMEADKGESSFWEAILWSGSLGCALKAATCRRTPESFRISSLAWLGPLRKHDPRSWVWKFAANVWPPGFGQLICLRIR